MAEVKKFPQSPYFDDFEEEKNFLRILFRPGYTVQTRELNQLQTILQDQIGVISDFSVANNSRVIGGETSLVRQFPFIKLSAAAILAYPIDSYADATFVATNGVKGKIQFVVPASGADPTTFYVNYESASSDGLSQVVGNASNITITLDGGATQVLPVANAAATGNAAAVVLNEGIFYYNKSFVRTERQLLLLSKYTSDFTDDELSVGFLIKDEIVKPENDIGLLDNATGTTNDTAPGAHRYKSTISLVLASDLTEEQLRNYVELVRIVGGEIAAKARVDNEFAVLEQILARRTYDESGDYIVDDFIVDVREHLLENNNGGVYTAAQGGDEAKLALKFDDGVAYIRGYEVRTVGSQIVDMPKARTTASATNAIIQTQFANAIFCYDLVAYPIMSAKLLLKNSANTTIGTAFVRGFEYVNEQVIGGSSKKVYRLDLVNVQFLAGGAWSDIANVAYDASVSATYPFTAKVNTFEADARESALVYAMPYGFSQSIDPQVSFFYKEISTTSVDSTVTISTGTSVESFDDETTSFVVYADYNTGFTGIPASVTVIDSQNVSLNIANIVGTATPGNVPVRIIAKTFCSAPVSRTKTLVSSFVNTGLTPSARVQLTKADAFKLISVVTSGGVNVTDSYVLDTGARDTYYDFASIVLKSGEAVPTGTLTVTFSYFEHGPTGDFFTPTSYVGVQYEDIPYYTTANGSSIFLGSAVDYRQRRTSANALEKVGRHAFVTDDQLITDITYYMGRSDRVMLTKAGKFILVQGAPALSPQLPAEIPDAITLYVLNVAPYTFGPSAVTTVKMDHRRYTMRDIGKLETRISNVEEVALLTSLERDVVAEDFEGRFKSGFVVDNFVTSNTADFESPDYKIALDLTSNEIRPMNVSTFIDVDKIDGTETNVTTHDNGATTLSYTLKPLAAQLLASTIVRIQPYISYDWIGDMALTPSGDIWFETQEVINTSITNIHSTYVSGYLWSQSAYYAGFTSSASNANTFDGAAIAGVWNMVGGVWRNEATGAWANAYENAQLQAISARTTGSDNRISISTNQIAIPFIRARAVKFEATGLKPGTRVYPSFDGVNVSAYVSLEGDNAPAGIPGWSFPAGYVHGAPATLIANGNGTCSGVFRIPGGMFRTGARNFKLSDNIDPKGDHLSTVANFTYSAQGTLIQEVAAASTVTTSATYIWKDPLAQSFLVDDEATPGGAYVAAVDLYFGPVGRNVHDVVVEIRRMINGYPAGEAIYKHAVAKRKASEIVGSNDGSVSVRFTFQSPVYLPSNEEYSFVVLSGSETLSLWCSEIGKKSYMPGDTLSATGPVISKQPYLGSMFMSQNSKTWTADQIRDIKFSIQRCSFVPSGQVDFINSIPANDLEAQANIHKRRLQNNPLYFTQGSTTVYVSGWGHGFSVGDTFKLKNVDASGTYFGVPIAEIFDVDHTVTSVDVFGFAFTTTTAAAATGRQGGNTTFVDGWAVDFSVAQLLSDAIVVDGTNVSYTMSNRRKDAYASGQFGSVPLVSDNMYDMKGMYVVKNSTDGGVKMNVALSTTKENLSPIVYSDRLGVNVISNVVNDVTLLNSGGVRQAKSSPARYIQKQVSLVNPANELRVYVDANLPAGTSINAYYKVGQGSTSEQAEWIRLPQDGALTYTDDPSKFFTQKFIKSFESEFQVFSVLIEFVSSDKTRVPRLRDYRALALNV